MNLLFELLSLLFFVAALAGFIDAISRGGGLIVLPSLLLAGLSPAEALATNKVQGIFGKLSAVRYYLNNGLINLRTFVPSYLRTADYDSVCVWRYWRSTDSDYFRRVILRLVSRYSFENYWLSTIRSGEKHSVDRAIKLGAMRPY